MPDSIKIRKPPPETAIARPEESAVIPENLAVMPIREMVLFPGIIQPLTVGRTRSLALIQDAVMGDRIFAVMTQ